MFFDPALASSVGVKDGTLTSRAVTLTHPERFLGNKLKLIWHTLRNTLRLVYLSTEGGGILLVPYSVFYFMSVHIDVILVDITGSPCSP